MTTNEQWIDLMAKTHYEKGREQDGRTFTWDQLSESTRVRHRERMRAALEAVANFDAGVVL